MQNQEIIKIIDNLKGRKNYEQKKATKLGFSSLYSYFEDKLLKEKKAIELKKKELEEALNTDKLEKKEKKTVVVVKLIFPFLFFKYFNYILLTFVIKK